MQSSSRPGTSSTRQGYKDPPTRRIFVQKVASSVSFNSTSCMEQKFCSKRLRSFFCLQLSIFAQPSEPFNSGSKRRTKYATTLEGPHTAKPELNTHSEREREQRERERKRNTPQILRENIKTRRPSHFLASLVVRSSPTGTVEMSTPRLLTITITLH